jgi:hypothetical protein
MGNHAEPPRIARGLRRIHSNEIRSEPPKVPTKGVFVEASTGPASVSTSHSVLPPR